LAAQSPAALSRHTVTMQGWVRTGGGAIRCSAADRSSPYEMRGRAGGGFPPVRCWTMEWRSGRLDRRRATSAAMMPCSAILLRRTTSAQVRQRRDRLRVTI